LTFNGISKWVKLINKIEYLTKNHTGLGAKCIFYGKVGEIEASSIAEIIDYTEYERMAFRAQGDFTIFTRVILNPKRTHTELRVIIFVVLSSKLATEDIRREVHANLLSAFDTFRRVANNLT
jgi:hypothetical protein